MSHDPNNPLVRIPATPQQIQQHQAETQGLLLNQNQGGSLPPQQQATPPPPNQVPSNFVGPLAPGETYAPSPKPTRHHSHSLNHSHQQLTLDE